jgi:tetratricopeptide (TPR) repeat protein
LLICKNCGKELKDGTKFCPECGTKIVNDDNIMMPKKVKQAIETQPAEKSKYTPEIQCHFDKVDEIWNSEDDDYDAKKAKVINEYTKALEIDPNCIDALEQRGYQYQGDDNDKAIADFSKIIQIAPSYLDAYDARADVYFDKEEYQKDIDDRQKYIELKRQEDDWNEDDAECRSDIAEEYNYIGVCYDRLAKTDAAIENYKLSIKYDSEESLVWHNLAMDYYNMGNEWDNAISCFEQYLQKKPLEDDFDADDEDTKRELFNATEGLAISYYSNEQYQKSLELLKKLEQFNNKSKDTDWLISYMQSKIYFMFGQFGDSANAAKKVLRIKPDEKIEGTYVEGLIYEGYLRDFSNVQVQNIVNEAKLAEMERRIITILPDFNEKKDGFVQYPERANNVFMSLYNKIPGHSIYHISGVSIFKFPPNHPALFSTYAMCDVAPLTYVTLSSFHDYCRHLKYSAFIELCAALGAKEICLKYANINNQSVDLKADVTAPFLELGLDGSYQRNKETGEMIAYEYGEENKEIKDYDSPWIATEPTWASMIKGRHENALKSYNADFNYQDDFGINANLSAKFLGCGINIGGTFKDMTKITMKYKVIFW